MAQIRAAKPHDLPTVAAFWLAMFEEIGMIHRSDMAAGWEDRFAAFFAERIVRGEARFGLAVEPHGIVATAGALIRDSYPSVIHGIRSGYIFCVRVEPDFRGRGLAKALTQDAIRFLRERGCGQIRLHASAAGKPIYEALGFAPTNEMELY